MAQTKLGDAVVNTSGNIPAIGSPAPDFSLAGIDLKEHTLKDYTGKNIVMNIFPSIDTRVCAMSVRAFNKDAAAKPDTVILCISKDLPFAFKRFCAAEGIDQVVTLSDFRNKGFAKNYGVEMIDGGMAGLLARCVIVVDKNGNVKYTELVPAIGQEPDYEAALRAI